MNRIACILSLCLACASLLSQAQVYKWIDKDGKVQYSDSPPPAGCPAADCFAAPRPDADAADRAGDASA